MGIKFANPGPILARHDLLAKWEHFGHKFLGNK